MTEAAASSQGAQPALGVNPMGGARDPVGRAWWRIAPVIPSTPIRSWEGQQGAEMTGHLDCIDRNSPGFLDTCPSRSGAGMDWRLQAALLSRLNRHVIHSLPGLGFCLSYPLKPIICGIGPPFNLPSLPHPPMRPGTASLPPTHPNTSLHDTLTTRPQGSFHLCDLCPAPWSL